MASAQPAFKCTCLSPPYLRKTPFSFFSSANPHPYPFTPTIGILSALLFLLIGPFLFTPSIFPIFLTCLYSFWVPQIWRNARRGNGRALGWGFVLGMSGGRLVLPLCELFPFNHIAQRSTNKNEQTHSHTPTICFSPNRNRGFGV